MAVYTTIDKPSDFFNTKIWTGNATERQITLDFQPDWVWIKNRGQTFAHILTDSVRGATKAVFTNNTNAEATNAQDLKSFDSGGFTIGTDGNVNSNNQPIVGWSWKAGGSASSNSDGSITSSVSANTTAGFSIVSYQGNATAGATIGHGLGTAPHWIIMKDRSNARDFFVFHQSTGATNRLKLNATNTSAGSTYLNDAAPTSSVYAVDGGTAGNASGANYIAYCFAEKQGYSKFGSYKGNGNADGPFIHLGFKPAFLIIKPSSKTEEWMVMDTTRDPENAVDSNLYANQNYSEADYDRLDVVSNGFKVRTDSGHLNTDGATMIYMCFAENPFVTSKGVPTVAR